VTGSIRKSAVFLAALLPVSAAAGSTQAPARVGPRSIGAGLTLTNVRAHGRTLVATGSNGRIIVSRDDGRTWARVSSSVGSNLRGVAYGGGRWLAVGDLGAAATSTDGVHWTAVDLGSVGAFRAVTYARGAWVAGANEGTVLVSTDEMRTWRRAQIGTTVPFWGAASSSGLTILTGDDGGILTSRDRLSWTLRQAPVPFEPIRDSRAFMWQVAHGPPGLVAVGARGAVAFSHDGQSWSAPRTPLTQTLRGVAYGRGRFVTVGEDGQIGASRDGRRWTLVRRVPTNEILRGVTFTGDAFVAVGDYGTVLRSRGGIKWKIILDGARRGLSAVTYGRSRFVAAGAGGRVLRSQNGIGWKAATVPTRRHLYGVGGGPSGFVAVGAKGVLLSSVDGRRWTSRKSGTRQSLRTVSFLNGRWYAAGDEGVFLSSGDGRTWKRDSSVAPFSVRQLAAGSGVQVAAGAGIIARRPPGGDWTLDPAGDYRFKTGVGFGGGWFVVVGHAGGIVRSRDGSDWTPSLISAASNLDAVAYSDGLWLLSGGTTFLAISNDDAATWRLVPVPTHSSIRSIVFGGERWVAVGDQGVILSSPDAIHWSASAG
jgi:hypothetical protein